jgi:uncharacterized membrane protein
MLKIEYIYYLVGVVLLAAAWLALRDTANPRRWVNAAFWAILAVAFLAGDAIEATAKNAILWPAQAMGIGVIALAVLAAFGLGRGDLREAAPAERKANAQRFGNRLFAPALTIPVLTLIIVLLGPYLVVGNWALFDAHQPTLLALGVACVVALLFALVLTRAPPSAAAIESRRLLEILGWAAVLPMVLASLGKVFAATGVGEAIAAVVSGAIPTQSPLACVLAYGLGMVMLTIAMGNAFAAFPVMTAGIGLPLLIQLHHANPAIVGALGMLTGYCGTLLTPMAANYNIVPAALLELSDRNGVIRAQLPTALCLLAVNLTLMYFLLFA